MSNSTNLFKALLKHEYELFGTAIIHIYNRKTCMILAHLHKDEIKNL